MFCKDSFFSFAVFKFVFTASRKTSFEHQHSFYSGSFHSIWKWQCLSLYWKMTFFWYWSPALIFFSVYVKILIRLRASIKHRDLYVDQNANSSLPWLQNMLAAVLLIRQGVNIAIRHHRGHYGSEVIHCGILCLGSDNKTESLFTLPVKMELEATLKDLDMFFATAAAVKDIDIIGA